jgi:hypothetical protein
LSFAIHVVPRILILMNVYWSMNKTLRAALTWELFYPINPSVRLI